MYPEASQCLKAVNYASRIGGEKHAQIMTITPLYKCYLPHTENSAAFTGSSCE